MKAGYVVAVLVWFCCGQVVAGQAHVHGKGLLQLVQEDARVNITLEIPAMDLVGFERRAQTEEEHQALHKASLFLMDVEQILQLSPEANCSVQSINVHSSLLDQADPQLLAEVVQETGLEQSLPSASEHHADDERGHGHHDQNEHDEKEDRQDRNRQHADYKASYNFVCGYIDQLASISLLLFEQLPALEQIEVQVLSDKGDTLGRASATNTEVRW